MTAHQIKARSSSLEKPERDKRYLAWLRTQRCIICRRWQLTEAAHTGQRGAAMGQKATDYDALPLCADDHRLGPRAYHRFGSERRWAEFHGLDLANIRGDLFTRYALRYGIVRDFPGDAVAECGKS